MADHFDENPLIQALDAKRKAADEAAAAVPKVISIKTRAPWVPPEGVEAEAEPEVSDADIDEASLAVVTGVVEDFQAALLRGVALISFNNAEQCFEAHVSLPLGLSPADGAVRMLGSLKVLEDHLLDIASNFVDVLAKPGSDTARAFEAAGNDTDEDPEQGE